MQAHATEEEEGGSGILEIQITLHDGEEKEKGDGDDAASTKLLEQTETANGEHKASDTESDDWEMEKYTPQTTTNTEILSALANGNLDDPVAQNFNKLGKRSGSMLKLPVHAMSVPSVIALYQSHAEEGLLKEEAALKMDIHGPNRPPLSLKLPKNVTVIRESQTCEIKLEDVVPGDLIRLTSGLSPVDCRLISISDNFKIDNSAIAPFCAKNISPSLSPSSDPHTLPEAGSQGPSESERKSEDVSFIYAPITAPDLTNKEPMRARNMAFCGLTNILEGEGTAIVTNTGVNVTIAEYSAEERSSKCPCCCVA